jgi:hypothetical protein
MTERQQKQRRRNINRLCLFTVIVVVYAVAVATKWSRATDSDVSLRESLGGWERAHVWWQRGQCTDCHRQGEDGEVGELRAVGTEPQNHQAECWSEMHGRADIASAQRCFVCHSADNCQSCHNRAPLTHTSDFLHPSSNNLDSNRHVLLARLRPSSCLVCHGNFVSTCGECHAPGEVHDWQQQGFDDLGEWAELLRSGSTHPAPTETSE